MKEKRKDASTPTNKLKQAKAAFCEHESKFRLIFESEPECVKLLGPDGSLLEMNPAGLAMIEADSIEQVAGQSLYPLIADEYRKAFKDLTKRVFAGESGILEFEIVGLKGGRRWLETHASPLRDSSGSIKSLLGITRDITEQTLAEKERKIIFEIIQGAITTPNLDEFLKLIHRSISQIVYAENCFVMLHDPVNDMDHFEFWVDKHDPPPPPHVSGKSFSSYVLRTGQPLLLTEELKKRMFEEGEAEQIGSTSASWLGVPLRTPSRTIGVLVLQNYEDENAYSQRDLEFLSSVGDQIALAIERKRADEALSESEDRYRDLVEHSHDLICTHDLDGRVLSVNQTAAGILGYDRDALQSRNIREILLPEFREGFDDYIAELQKKGVARGVMSVQTRNGEERVWEYANTLRVKDVAVPIVRGVARDVTEQRRAEAALRESEERYRQIFERNLAGVYHSTPEGQTLDCNNAFVRMFRYKSKKDMLSRPAADFYPTPANRERFLAELRQSRELTNYETEMLRKDGSVMWCLENVVLVRGADGTESIHGTIIDITERKLADEALRQSQERLAGVIGSAMDAIISFDEDQRVVLFNTAAEQIFLISLKEAIGMPLDRFIPDRFRAAHKGHVRDFGESPLGSRSMGTEGLKKLFGLRANGEEFPIETSVSKLESDGKMFYTVILRDITERKRADEALRESHEHNRRVIEDIFKFVPEALLVFAGNLNLYKDNQAFEDLVRTYAPKLYYTEPELRELLLQEIRAKVVSADAGEIRISPKDRDGQGTRGPDHPGEGVEPPAPPIPGFS